MVNPTFGDMHIRPSFLKKLYDVQQTCATCPPPALVEQYFKDLLGILYRDYSDRTYPSVQSIEAHLYSLKVHLDELLHCNPHNSQLVESRVADKFFDELEHVYDKLNKDVQAIFEGDPAAKSPSEVIRSYPGFYAIAAYRIAHELHKLKIVDLPRIITEHAHSRTGIDIHPGATIGEYFCIDHGTGVVIGETAVIGNHVKLYQGVTLGALSVEKEDANTQRHPTIEDQVVIYAGATVLGGNTVIGTGSIIGGNVWITRSVPPYTKIYYKVDTHENLAEASHEQHENTANYAFKNIKP